MFPLGSVLRRLTPLLLLTAACFADSEQQEDDSTDGTSTGVTSTTGADDATTAADSTSDDADTTQGPTTAADSDDASTSGSDESGSSSGGESCVDCLVDAKLCEGFETWPLPSPWGPLNVGETEPMRTTDLVHCGPSALGCEVHAGDPACAVGTSVAVGMTTVTPQHLRFFANLGTGCLPQNTDLVRLVRVVFTDDPANDILYGFDIMVRDGSGALRINSTGGLVSTYDFTAVAVAADVWQEYELDFDVSQNPPSVTVSVDGVVAVLTEGPVAPSLETIEPVSFVVGPTPDDFTFAADCTAAIDDFSFGPG